ncbi:hypothetical protein [Crocosphaera sp. XPORK-15E]|uniref:hypothetical protein n=1 Tax=Crocosphaera sp. XPORK-15E TaxID=3110247 RepID=UPI002B20AFD9|nr:hypothetical protein [Crocosphaera sp. XPORK-15E]MEA5533235.1 hypothetical protein [Crocosphaera sp. XPORK-15E]
MSGYDPISGIDRNLTYIDISVVTGGGGSGGGNGRKNDSLSGTSLDFNAIAAEISGLTATNNDVFL